MTLTPFSFQDLKELAKSGSSPNHLDIYTMFYLADEANCNAAIRHWVEGWFFCPICREHTDEGGTYHKEPKDLVN